ncbi:hypothetical protein X975_16031, partial [Stegodyphus mimosarum]
MILLKYGKHIPVKCLPEEISTTKRGEKVSSTQSSYVDPYKPPQTTNLDDIVRWKGTSETKIAKLFDKSEEEFLTF